MSVMHRNGKIHGERCDVCGKLTRSKDGYYLKPDGVNAGYMHSQEWYGLKEVDDGTDICEECAAEVATKMQGQPPAAPPVLQAEPDVQQLISAVYATITPKDGIRKTVVLAGLHRIAERAERAAFEKAAQVAEGMNTVSAMHADGLRDPRIVALDIAKGIRALADSPVSGGAPKCTCGNSADGICRPGPTCGNW